MITVPIAMIRMAGVMSAVAAADHAETELDTFSIAVPFTADISIVDTICTVKCMRKMMTIITTAAPAIFFMIPLPPPGL